MKRNKRHHDIEEIPTYMKEGVIFLTKQQTQYMMDAHTQAMIKETELNKNLGNYPLTTGKIGV